MSNDDIENLIKRMMVVFATKDDLERFATKDDIKKSATKEDLERFATKDDLERFATKDDLKGFATKDDIEGARADIKNLEQKLSKKIDILDHKTDKILEYASNIEEDVSNHEKRLKRIESVPVVAHELKKIK